MTFEEWLGTMPEAKDEEDVLTALLVVSQAFLNDERRIVKLRVDMKLDNGETATIEAHDTGLVSKGLN